MSGEVQAADVVAPTYEWNVNVRTWDYYGDKVISRTPAKVLGATRDEVTTKVRVMFGATYDGFRKFWSHDWTLNSVREVPRNPPAIEGEVSA